MDKVRQAAFKILNRINRDNAYSNLILKPYFSDYEFDSRDIAFLSTLVNGVLERLYTIDYNLSLYLKQNISKLKPQVLTVLRLGAFQILFLDRVPDFVAVNESVKLAKKNGLSFASGLVNAVLRKLATKGLLYPEKEKDFLDFLRVKYSFPSDTIKMFYEAYGEENAISILEYSLSKAPLYAWQNQIKGSFESLQTSLLDEEIEIEKLDFPAHAFVFKNIENITNLKAFKEGLFNLQDLSSQICASAIAPKSASTLIDTCAAPGGKSFHLAMQMQNKGRLIACDIHKHKIDLIKEGAKRLGLSIIEPRPCDALDDDKSLEPADYVLCDVPCSGFGVVARKPEIKYKPLDSLNTLPNLQYNILKNSSSLVKKSGVLTYSTCTLNPKENEDVCKRFLKSSPNFRELRVLPNIKRQTLKDTNSLTIFPHMFGSDGFFIAQFERVD